MTSSVVAQDIKKSTARVVQAKADPLIDLATVKRWTAKETSSWAKTLISSADRVILDSLKLTGQQLISAIESEKHKILISGWAKLSLNARTTFAQKHTIWLKDQRNTTPIVSWMKTYNHPLFIKLVQTLLKGLLKILCYGADIDPPVGDGQCQIRAARNAFTLKQLWSDPSGKVLNEWISWLTELETTVPCSADALAALVSIHPSDESMTSDVWFLLSCYIMTLGKVVEPLVNVTAGMHTDITQLAKEINCSPEEAQYVVRVLRDHLAKESVRYLRHQIQILDHSDQLVEMVGPLFTEFVRGGWPSIPMWNCYSALIDVAWNHVPIICVVDTIPSNGTEIIVLNPHVVNSGSAWVIQGCRTSVFKNASLGWIDTVKMSAADHPQYPVETTGAKYQSLIKESQDWAKHIPGKRLKWIKSMDPVVLASEALRAQMKTENDQDERLITYRHYRDSAAENGCSLHNPEHFVIQHVYPGNAALAIFALECHALDCHLSYTFNECTAARNLILNYLR